MAVLCGLVAGNSRELDLAKSVFLTATVAAHIRSSVWWEHVDSPANIADGGSRIGVSDPVAKEMGIKLTQIPWPTGGSNLPLLPTQLLQEIIGQVLNG